MTSSGRDVQVSVKTLTGKTIWLDMNTEETVEIMKQKIQDKEGIPPDQQKLIWGGHEMYDRNEWVRHDPIKESQIHLVLRLREPHYTPVPRSSDPRTSSQEFVRKWMIRETQARPEFNGELPKKLDGSWPPRVYEWPARVLTAPIPEDAKEVPLTHECEFEVPDVEINGQRSHCIGGVFRVQFQFLETKRVRFRLLTPVLHPEVLPDGALMMNRVGYSKWDEDTDFLRQRAGASEPSVLARVISLLLWVDEYNVRNSYGVSRYLGRLGTAWEKHARQSVELYAVRDRSWTPQRNSVFPTRIRESATWLLSAAESPFAEFPGSVARMIVGVWADTELEEFGRDADGHVDPRALIDGADLAGSSASDWHYVRGKDREDDG